MCCQVGGTARPSNISLLVSRWKTGGRLLAIRHKGSHLESSLAGLLSCSQEGRRWCHPCQLESQFKKSLHCHTSLRLQSLGNQGLKTNSYKQFKELFSMGWTCDRWSVGSGRVAAAAWAPDSLQLVFATTDEPVLYCLSFQAGAEAAVPVMDLSMVTLPSSGEAAGGLVQDLQWEPTGRRLAVSFRETAPLLLLRCRPGPLPGRLSPVGWIFGQQATERPNCIQFQQAGAVMGAVLSIGWSSGRLQQLPLVFGGPDTEGELWSQQPDPALNLFSISD